MSSNDMDSQSAVAKVTYQAIEIIQWAGLSGLVISGIYGLMFSVKSAFLAMLASLLGYALGGLIGFLFGFPRYTESGAVAGVDDLKAVSNGGGGERGRNGPKLRPNTNLERIVDWLMTMIIGATLVSIRDLLVWANKFFKYLTLILSNPDSVAISGVADTSPMPGVLLVLPFAIAGFLHLFLWARAPLMHDWSDADRRRAEEDEKRQSKIDSVVEKLEKEGLWSVKSEEILRVEEDLATIRVEESVIDDISRRYKESKSWDDEPMDRFGPAQANGFLLQATVKEKSGANPYAVTLKVSTQDGHSISGHVAFLLHNSFASPLRIEPMNGAQCEHTFYCSEPFVVGVLVVEEAQPTLAMTRLGLDLAQQGAFKT